MSREASETTTPTERNENTNLFDAKEYTMTKRHHHTLLGAGLALCLPCSGAAAQVADSTQSETRSPLQRASGPQRVRRLPAPHLHRRAIYPRDFRTIDGLGNNTMNPEWGAAAIGYVRLMPADYADGFSAPAGADRPSARLISNLVNAQDGADLPNPLGYSDFIWQWGQFVDHDVDETPVMSPGEPFDILVPTGDPWFDPFGTGIATIPLDRSTWTLVDGVREQYNFITAYIDASNVYGSDEARASELRTNDGTGRMKTSAGNLLPFNVNGFPNAPTSADPSYFLAGDVRCNEQVGLTAMHTLFVREHNRLADLIAASRPGLSGDQIYQRARAIVAAEIQAITYNEFLPKLLGRDALPRYRGYRSTVNAGISNIFAAAAYRVGHTMLSTRILRLDASGSEIDAGHLDLAAAFFVPQEVIDHGIDPVLRGLASQHAQDIDPFVVDDVRNFLFGPPGSGGFDLPSLNIQRGRDHGIPSYNAIRAAFGRPVAVGFDDVNPDPVISQRLASVYDSVDDIDAWVGLLAEPHRPGAYVGETLYRVLRDQFIRLRDGDRFWYESYLPRDLVRRVNRTTLGDIIRMNTDIGSELQDDVFAVAERCVVDMAEPFGELTIDDFYMFISLFSMNDLAADMNGDGLLDIVDVQLYLNMFVQGCDF